MTFATLALYFFLDLRIVNISLHVTFQSSQGSELIFADEAHMSLTVMHFADMPSQTSSRNKALVALGTKKWLHLMTI